MSRASVVAMLVAVEILIAGIAIYVIGGNGGWHGMHRVAFAAAPIAPLEAGNSPRIAVDDPDSRVEVELSTDGLVHVRDATSTRGFVYGSEKIAQLHVVRTADGVSISRPHTDGWSGMHLVFGESTQKIYVDVPSGAHLEIARCSGADVTGLTGGVNVHSVDGHITLANLQGTIVAHSDDGYINATGIRGDSLTVQSNDGHITLRDVTVPALDARTNDGRVEASALTIAGAQPRATLHSNDGSMHVKGSFAPGGAYEVSSNDGSIEVGLAGDADLTLTASTGDGKVYVDGSSQNQDGDSAQHTIKLGAGSGSMKLATSDGSIHITTNGAQ